MGLKFSLQNLITNYELRIILILLWQAQKQEFLMLMQGKSIFCKSL
ncbi:hypothetical protein GXM_06351 [Nostoc sphaeroides CCNUC1]|uniref:Uncharacterized protein n=1 Tax=Nostoc sphaeroides CCNUC1 TaxID=2653204 RepID=A0A5P8W7V3_9NOSO|nr:hypothetical protein GXM_06351 [Nostoc sphaeroides CCNUC1]